jgi:class 3 adenylate cyclase/tetratricopeptide (TPR) repeat protein
VRELDVQARALSPYVPRLMIDWLRSTPDEVHREVDGSLAFVDISGFTQLTERLAARGRIGAEEMSDILDRTFAGLLAQAYEVGAGLVKWGGDAVLLLFDGPEHAARAAQAAWRMQRTMARIGRVDSTAGHVRLRMSVGLHSAGFDFFLVGDPAMHRELLVCGPATTTLVSMEKAADAGQVVLSEQAAAQLDPAVLGAPKGPGILLRAEPRPSASSGVIPAGAVDGLDLSVALPAPIRERVLAGVGEPEHRTIAVGFVQFSGTDDLLRRSGPEGLARALDECIRTVQHATSRHGVTFFETDVDADGGKVMLTAGAPRTAGNDDERMLHACRQIVDRFGQLPVRIGVNRGNVFAGDFGPPFRRTFSVKGDAVNLAARVMGRADPGQLLATAAVLQHSRTEFESEPLAPFRVKGKSEPVIAAIVGAASGARQDAGRTAGFVGRAEEMAVLRAALEGTRARRGRVIDLVGEPGIGKSRLVAELLTEAEQRDVVVATTACAEYEASTPYFPFRSLLRGVLGLPADATGEQVMSRLSSRTAADAPELGPWLALLGAPLDVGLPETPETASLDQDYRKARLDQVAEAFLDVVLPTPTVLVFDDVHLMDEASAGLLERLTRDPERRPWLVVVTRRDAEGGFVPRGPAVTELRPGPLSASAARELVETISTETPLSDFDVELLAKRAAGNPLFLRGLVHAVAEGGDLAGLPESVEELLASQIDRLPLAERTVLRYASVLGVSFSEEMLRAILAGNDLPTGRSSLARLSYFVTREGIRGQLRFQHALIRDTAYAGLAFRRRQELHALAGELIEASVADPTEQCELLAMHFDAAGSPSKVWYYARVAAERAKAKFASAEAAEFYARAARAGQAVGTASAPLAERADVLAALGDARLTMGRLAQAGEAYQSARRVGVVDPIRDADLLLKVARVRQRQGNFIQTARWLGRAMRSLDGMDTRAAAEARSLIASNFTLCRLSQGRFADSRTWGLRAIDEAGTARSKPARARAYTVNLMLQASTGLYLDVDYGTKALALYGELGDLTAQAHCANNMGILALEEGDWDRGVRLLRRARDGFARVGASTDVGAASYNLADVLVRQGRLDEAAPLLAHALREARAAGDQGFVADVVREQGRAATRAGRLEEGLALLQESRQILVELGAAMELADADGAIAENRVLAGEPANGLDLVLDALARARVLGAVVLLPTLERIRALALLRLGRRDEALGAIEAGLVATEQEAARLERGFLLCMLAGVGDPESETTRALRAEGSGLLESFGVVQPPPLG